MVTSSDNALASRVIDDNGVLVLGLCSLPDLDLASTTEDTDTHSRQQVVCSVGVQVDTAVEDGGSVLADGGRNQSLATGVVLDEVGHIVNDTSNSNESLAILGLGNEVIPVDDGQLVQRSTPVEDSTLLVELLLQLLDTTLLDLVGTELLEIVGEAELLPGPDRPLGGVVLPPLNGVAVVGGELVVEVVVTLTQGDQSGNDVVTRRVAIVEGLVTEPVGQGIYAEGGLLHKEDAEDTGVDETTHPIIPAETTDKSRENKTHGNDTLDKVSVLPDNNGVVVEVSDIGTANALGVLLHDHPSQVRVQETLANRVGVLLGIGVTVVSTVVARPPSDGTFNSTSTDSGEVDLEGS